MHRIKTLGWDAIEHALTDASEAFNPKVDILNPPEGSIDAVAKLNKGLGPKQYDAVVSTIADVVRQRGPLSQPTTKRLPLIPVDTGDEDASKAEGALFHLGRTSVEAGLMAVSTINLEAKNQGTPTGHLDLSALIAKPIRSGAVAFAIDQRLCPPGYWSAGLLAEHRRPNEPRFRRSALCGLYSRSKPHARMSPTALNAKWARATL